MEVTESISVYTGVDTIHETVFDIAGDVRGRVCGTQTLYRSGLRVFFSPPLGSLSDASDSVDRREANQQALIAGASNAAECKAERRLSVERRRPTMSVAECNDALVRERRSEDVCSSVLARA
jgi:hypothetical protein